MRLPDEQEDRGSGASVIGSIALVSFLILAVLAVVFISNRPKNNTGRNNLQAKATPTPQEETVEFAEGESDIESLYRENKLRSEDLEFWDMYKEKDLGPEVIIPTPSPSPESPAGLTEEEMAQDGNHILVSYKDGSEEWIKINEEIPRQDYDFTRMKSVNGKMTYYEGNKRLSRLGIELSEENGDVDFAALKESGIDFVMLRAGARGYETGLLAADKNFASNLGKAETAGLDIGVYFSSQAVTTQEAVQEAELVLKELTSHRITYPVAFRMDSIANDTSRTDVLDAKERTEIAEAFLYEVEKAGYSVAVYGTKEWLLTDIEESILKERDIWLSEQVPIPEYPYQFKMWEYEGGQEAAGVKGDVNYTISFVDYSRR